MKKRAASDAPDASRAGQLECWRVGVCVRGVGKGEKAGVVRALGILQPQKLPSSPLLIADHDQVMHKIITYGGRVVNLSRLYVDFLLLHTAADTSRCLVFPLGTIVHDDASGIRRTCRLVEFKDATVLT